MLDLPDLLPPLPQGTVPVDPHELLPPAEGLVDALALLRPDGPHRDVLGGLGCPAADLLATPLGARAGLLAAARGRAFTHHELRRRLPMPAGLEPERAVWTGGTVPGWQDGVLAEPKYFSFFQDDPHSPFNPNHRGKWRSHELLHGVVGWCWHPSITRFEFYAAARLAELLPVVHWYGLDEIFRDRCPQHHGGSPPREQCAACEERAQRPSWHADSSALRQQALTAAQAATEHLSSEWAASLQELDRGQAVPRPRPGLDSSSDAQGYLAGHWNRITAWSFGSWVERFCVAGVDHQPDAMALAARVAATCRSLVSGPCPVDPQQQQRLRTRRVLQDLGYRALLVLEHVGEGVVEDTLMPHIDALANVASTLLAEPQLTAASAAAPSTAAPSAKSPAAVIAELLAAVDHVAARIPDDLASAVGALGLRFMMAEQQVDAGLDQVMEGLQSAVPDTWSAMRDAEDVAWRFAASSAFDGPGTLGRRFAGWWSDQGGADRDLVTLEATVLDLPRVDEEAELFAVVPEGIVGVDQGVCRANATLRRLWVDGEVMADEDPVGSEDAAAGWDRMDAQGRVEVAVVWLSGEPRVMVLSAVLAAALAVVEAQEVDRTLSEDMATALQRLIEGGLVVAWPAPRQTLALSTQGDRSLPTSPPGV